MARFRRFSRFRQRARVIIQKVRARRYRPRNKNNKMLLMLGGLAVIGFLFKDKIKTLLQPKP